MEALARNCSCCRTGKICGQDVDDLFAFEVPKISRIRDRRLGIISYILMLAIFIYILVYQIILQNSYLKYLPAVASLRVYLLEPATSAPNVASRYYCCGPDCTALSSMKGQCTCGSRGAIAAAEFYSCSILDGVVASQVSGSQLLVATNIKEYAQVYNTSCNNCSKIWIPATSRGLYVAGIEDYVVVLDHSVTQPDLKISVPASGMNGALSVDPSACASPGPTCTSLQNQLCQGPGASVDHPDINPTQSKKAPCFVKAGQDPRAGKNIDTFPVSTLLQVMGFPNLDDDLGQAGMALRYNGMPVTVTISYRNIFPNMPGVHPVYYTYSLAPIFPSPYKETQVIWTAFPTNRTRRDMKGLLISLATQGQLGQFDFLTLLMTFTTSLGLLAVSTLVTKSLATMILSLSSYYKAIIYHVSPDFSDVKELTELTEEELVVRLDKMSLPTHGKKEQKILRLLEATPPKEEGGLACRTSKVVPEFE